MAHGHTSFTTGKEHIRRGESGWREMAVEEATGFHLFGNNDQKLHD